MDYRALGPLEVLRDGALVDIGGPRQQIVLALLLLEAGRVVAIDRLVDAVWGTDPPATARSQIQICVSSLRRLLAVDQEKSSIATRRPGYVLTLGEDRLDLLDFADLAVRGRQLATAGEPGPAIDAFRAGLALWRGTPFAGPAGTSTVIADHAVRLEEERSAVLSECIETELSFGRHHELIGELRGEVERDPLRESLRGQLMIALHRAGRQADALREYRIARTLAVDELGIEPSDELRKLEQRILRGDSTLQAPTPARVVTAAQPTATPQRPPSAPRLLPSPIGDFTGRAAEIATLVEGLHRTATPGDFSVPVALVTGRDGLGKSSLLVHVAHRLAETFPDGQLHADLHDVRGTALVYRILERFLKALGHPADAIPEDAEERAALYRNLLADRQVLICLDDVYSESQISALMPGAGGCSVLVGSCRRLTAVPGAVRVQLGPFAPAESIRLLASVVGPDRVAADPEGARALALACGHLPLAIRIAAARLAARPHWQLSTLADRLSDEDTRLNELQYGELAVRAGVALTHDNLSEPAKHLFCLLSLIDTPDFGAWVAGPLLDVSELAAEEVLEELVDMHLVDAQLVGTDGRLRYRFHNLVRAFARECASRGVSTGTRYAALSRALAALLFLTELAHSRTYGGDHLIVHGTADRRRIAPEVADILVADPFKFYDREHAMVVSGVIQAAAMGAHAVAWELAMCAVTGFEAHFRLQDWADTHEVALRAARQFGDLLGEASMLYSLGSLRVLEQRFPEADELLGAAQDIFTLIGSAHGSALVLRNRAYMDQLGGRVELARERGAEALEIFRAVGDPVGQASTMRNLSQLALDEERYGDALLLLHEAAELCSGLGNRRMSAQVLHRMGDALLLSGDPERAGVVFEQVLELVRATRDRVGEAYAMLGAGMVHLRLAEHETATHTLRGAEQLAVETGEQRIRGHIDLGMGEVLLATGAIAAALPLFWRAAERFRLLPAPLYEKRAHLLIEEAQDSQCGKAVTTMAH